MINLCFRYIIGPIIGLVVLTVCIVVVCICRSKSRGVLYNLHRLSIWELQYAPLDLFSKSWRWKKYYKYTIKWQLDFKISRFQNNTLFLTKSSIWMFKVENNFHKRLRLVIYVIFIWYKVHIGRGCVNIFSIFCKIKHQRGTHFKQQKNY